MKKQEIIQTLECCSTIPKKCEDCPLCNNLNCMNVSRQEAMQALKGSTERMEEVKEKFREMTARIVEGMTARILDEIEAALESNYAARKERIEKGHTSDDFLSVIEGKIAALRGMSDFVEQLLDDMLAQLEKEVEP